MISRYSISLLFPSKILCRLSQCSQHIMFGSNSFGVLERPLTASTQPLHCNCMSTSASRWYSSSTEIAPLLTSFQVYYGEIILTCTGQNDLPLAYLSACVAPAQLCCKPAVVYVIVHGSRWLELVAASSNRKEKTTPFGVNLMRSQVLYRAAQSFQHHLFASCFAG